MNIPTYNSKSRKRDKQENKYISKKSKTKKEYKNKSSYPSKEYYKKISSKKPKNKKGCK